MGSQRRGSLTVGVLDESGQEKRASRRRASSVRAWAGHALIASRQWIPAEQISNPIRALTSRPPPPNIPRLDPGPFRLWQYLATEQGPPTVRGDLPFVARCDGERISYPYLRESDQKTIWKGHTGGCRFFGADRVYTMYTGDPQRREVAQHIQFAFQNPQATDPKVDKQGRSIAKNFPRNYDMCVGVERCRKVPLLKHANSERAPDGPLFTSKVQAARRKYCPDLPGQGSGKECDEYPFASTKQAIGIDGKMENNVWVPSLNASLRMVSGEHNQASGRDLGAFYARYRVWPDGINEGGIERRPASAFFVRIKEGAPPTPSS